MIDKERLFKYVDMMVDSVWYSDAMDACPEKLGRLMAYSDIHKMIKDGEFDFPITEIRILEPETCRFKLAKTAYRTSIMSHEQYKQYSILIPECDKSKSLDNIRDLKYCPYCGKPIEEVKI